MRQQPQSFETAAQRRERINFELLEAATESDEDEIKRLLQAGASPDARDFGGRTPLMCAIGAQTLPWLLMSDDKNAGSVISPATILLLKAGSPVNAEDKQGTTALLLAARANNEPLCKELIRRKANPNHINKIGMSPLGVAAVLRNRTLLDLFLSAGADPKRGTYPPLVFAIAGLRLNGADNEDEEDSPSLAAAMMGRRQNDVGPIYDIVGRLLKAGADPNSSLPGFNTALHLAVIQSHPDIVRMLLKAGARPNVINSNGETPLSMLVSRGRGDLIRLLLEAGADPNTPRESDGRTALHLAVAQGSYTCTERLLAGGANRNARDHEGKTPLDIAKARRMTALVALLNLPARK